MALDRGLANGLHFIERRSNAGFPSRDSCLGYASQSGEVGLRDSKHRAANMTDCTHSGAYYAQTDNLQAEKYAQADFSLSASHGSVLNMTVEEKIRAIQKATGWKQLKLAEVFEVSQSTVNRWLSGSEPEGHRRDAINAIYSQFVESEPTVNDDKKTIRGEQEILATLQRIDGLSNTDIEVAFAVITNALKANKAGSEQADADDRSEPATPRRESTPSR
ncbi:MULTISPECIES: helix-turn-helix transcriptional regulator [unclassified Mesorhizobium]|uniref:helix-turn-helix domain-containing protein n=1 Tax=Mesorhizobium sp. M5C.F.Cr.IN.023.01.1.1 TaxID=2496768 RepID=UPI001FE1895D|nr:MULTISPECIES: helix-turn-helix transcriptional regulator [unclassified Mesorhizobium]